MESVNERIKQVFIESNLTQKEFAEKTGMAQSSISRVLNGIQKVDKRTIQLTASVFGVSLEWLETGNGTMREELPMQQEIADFLTSVAKDNEPYRDAVIYGISRTNPDQWKMLIEIAYNMVEAYEKRKKEGLDDGTEV